MPIEIGSPPATVLPAICKALLLPIKLGRMGNGRSTEEFRVLFADMFLKSFCCLEKLLIIEFIAHSFAIYDRVGLLVNINNWPLVTVEAFYPSEENCKGARAWGRGICTGRISIQYPPRTYILHMNNVSISF